MHYPHSHLPLSWYQETLVSCLRIGHTQFTHSFPLLNLDPSTYSFCQSDNPLVSVHNTFSVRGGNASKPQYFYRICVVGSHYASKRTNRIPTLVVRIHQFTCISTNTHIPKQENGYAALAYRRHAVVDARRIAVHFLNVWQNHMMCPIKLQSVVFTGVR